MARAWSSSSSLLLVLLAVAATAVAGARAPGHLAEVSGNATTSAELRGRRARRKALQNGLGRTPQMGYVRYARRPFQRFSFLSYPV